ncbi:hypothetical protein [Crossiella sp. SN42]|nr:hypothetical protein [Crossiella sp. SN42]
MPLSDTVPRKAGPPLEIETAYLELESTISEGRLLRTRTPAWC